MNKNNTKLVINHMYSRSLNIYGDLGNIYALNHLASKLNIDVETVNTELAGEFHEADIYFIGGGQDQDQILVYQDLLKYKEKIKSEVEKNKIFLLICGGYQLFGKFFVDGDGNSLEGLDILDLETRALNSQVESRCIGNIIVKLNEEFIKNFDIDIDFSEYIVGFENHGGQTKLLSDQSKPLGGVVTGFGNNSHDKLEGAFYRNIIGSYSHGSLLPKNPHLTFAIIKNALGNKNIKLDKNLKDLDLTLEKKAHEFILKNYE